MSHWAEAILGTLIALALLVLIAVLIGSPAQPTVINLGA